MRRLVGSLAVALACTGCFTVDRAASPLAAPGAEHVHVRNVGWNLFGCVPLVCGNEDLDSPFAWTFFQDEVRLDLVQAKIRARAIETGCEIHDLRLFEDSNIFFSYSYFPIPWILQHKEVQASATLRRRGVDE